MPSGGSSSNTGIKEPPASNPPLSSYIGDRKSSPNVAPATTSSKQGISGDDQQDTPRMFSKWITGSNKKPPAPANSQQGLAAGGNETSINENKDTQNLQLEQMINLLKTQYIKQTDVTTETAKNLLKEINKDMTLLYNRDPTKYGKYSPDKIQNLILDIQAEQAKPKPKGGQTFEKTLTNILTSNNPSIRSPDELTGIKGEQVEGTTKMTGGSKGKNKTLKNRRQRFNIRLV